MDAESMLLFVFFGFLIGSVATVVTWIKEKIDKSEYQRGYTTAKNDTMKAFNKRGLTELYVDVTGDKIIKITLD